jgi:hypothetical protein
MGEEPLPNPFDPTQNSSLVYCGVLNGIAEEIEDGPKTEKPNFPFFFPLVYHSINLEIQQRYSFAVRMCYSTAISFTICLIFNFFFSFFTTKIYDGKTSILQDLTMSLGLLIFGASLLFYVQYYSVYTTFRDGKPINKILRIQAFVIVAFAFLFLGFRGTGFCGIFYVIAAFNFGSVINKMCGLIITVWHVINFIFEIIFLTTIDSFSTSKDDLLNKEENI